MNRKAKAAIIILTVLLVIAIGIGYLSYEYLADKYNKAQISFEKTQASLDQTSAELVDTQFTLNETLKTLSNTQDSLVSMTVELTGTKNSLESTVASLADVQAENESQKIEMQSMQTAYDTAVSEAQKREESMQTELTNAYANIDVLNNTVDQLTNERDAALVASNRKIDDLPLDLFQWSDDRILGSLIYGYNVIEEDGDGSSLGTLCVYNNGYEVHDNVYTFEMTAVNTSGYEIQLWADDVRINDGKWIALSQSRLIYPHSQKSFEIRVNIDELAKENEELNDISEIYLIDYSCHSSIHEDGITCETRYYNGEILKTSFEWHKVEIPMEESEENTGKIIYEFNIVQKDGAGESLGNLSISNSGYEVYNNIYIFNMTATNTSDYTSWLSSLHVSINDGEQMHVGGNIYIYPNSQRDFEVRINLDKLAEENAELKDISEIYLIDLTCSCQVYSNDDNEEIIFEIRKHQPELLKASFKRYEINYAGNDNQSTGELIHVYQNDCGKASIYCTGIEIYDRIMLVDLRIENDFSGDTHLWSPYLWLNSGNLCKMEGSADIRTTAHSTARGYLKFNLGTEEYQDIDFSDVSFLEVGFALSYFDGDGYPTYQISPFRISDVSAFQPSGMQFVQHEINAKEIDDEITGELIHVYQNECGEAKVYCTEIEIYDRIVLIDLTIENDFSGDIHLWHPYVAEVLLFASLNLVTVLYSMWCTINGILIFSGWIHFPSASALYLQMNVQ